MPVTHVDKDLDACTLTITAEFAAPVERVWRLYADPRQLERIWGPPSHPATFVEHDLVPGARITYYMTGPDGETYRGWWLVHSVDEPYGFAFDDGFADEAFQPVPDLPVGHNDYRFTTDGDHTIATFRTGYDSADDLRAALEMGLEEGATQALNQIDAVLAE